MRICCINVKSAMETLPNEIKFNFLLVNGCSELILQKNHHN